MATPWWKQVSGSSHLIDIGLIVIMTRDMAPPYCFGWELIYTWDVMSTMYFMCK